MRFPALLTVALVTVTFAGCSKGDDRSSLWKISPETSWTLKYDKGMCDGCEKVAVEVTVPEGFQRLDENWGSEGIWHSAVKMVDERCGVQLQVNGYGADPRNADPIDFFAKVDRPYKQNDRAWTLSEVGQPALDAELVLANTIIGRGTLDFSVSADPVIKVGTGALATYQPVVDQNGSDEGRRCSRRVSSSGEARQLHAALMDLLGSGIRVVPASSR